MKTFTLQIRRAARAVRQTSAYLIPGRGARTWLEEIIRWGLRMSELRLYVLGVSLRDRRPIGVLVVGPAGATAATSGRVLPYGCLAGRLYLPADSELYPPVTAHELQAQLPGHLYVLHPSAGLLGFEEGDALGVADLLAAAPTAAETWDHARSGVVAGQRLRSVSVAQPPDLAVIMTEGRDDISTEPTEAAPASDADPAGGAVGNAARGLAYGAVWAIGSLAAGLGAIGRFLTGAAGEGSGGLAEWARQKLWAISERMQAARHRELSRLMHLMETDPDQGLRYALPLADSAAHRGVAPPGSRLRWRRNDFSLRRLGGGDAADFWDVPWDYQERLRQKYHEAARREVALGRHRRAAYIYAELLGDLHAAANVLRQGGHCREAAVLYKEHLMNPTQAAECLEEGGLLIEAVAIYEELERFEKAGDLYTTLGRHDGAEAAYRREVARLTAGNDLLAAAKLLEEKIARPDEALVVLAAGWPAARQAAECLTAQFGLLGRLGRHDESAELAKSFRDAGRTPTRGMMLVKALTDVTETYPHRGVRRHVTDAVQITAARSLGGLAPHQAAEVADALTRLFPHDRLLRRDADRYCSQRRRQWAAQPKPQRPAVTARATQVRSFDLPYHTVSWQAFAAAGGMLYAAGYRQHDRRATLRLLRHDWHEGAVVQRWDEHVPQEVRPRLCPDPTGLGAVLLGVGPDHRPALQRAPRTLKEARTPAGVPAWMPHEMLCFTYDLRGQIWVLRIAPTGCQIETYSRTGQLYISRPLVLPQGFEETEDMQMLVRDYNVWLAAGGRLVWDRGGSRRGVVDFGSPITGLTGSPLHTRARVAVTLGEGGQVLWPNIDGLDQERFGHDMFQPVATFIREGLLVVASGDEGRIYATATHRHEVRHVASFNVSAEEVAAVLPTDEAGQFALTADDRQVIIYEVPRR